MITFKDMIGSAVISDIPITQQHNIEIVVSRVNAVLKIYGKEGKVTSGYRSLYDHNRIYSQLNAKRRAKNLPELKVPMSSRHLSGEAVDIHDPEHEMLKWLKANPRVLVENKLWCEELDDQERVHFQVVPPRSGNRFFNP